MDTDSSRSMPQPHPDPVAAIAPDAPARKPRLALMGEFSAGKSTLSNMLLGADPLPVRITATRLPPVWISYGREAAFRVARDGTEHPINVDTLDDVPLEDTRMIRMFMTSDALQLCDLIDMPGISDPNMSAEIWQGVIDEADCVIWCTHATQAWRQSEAATWEMIRPRTNGENLLLITQFDKLQNDRDRARVKARVTAETRGQFRAIYPISLTEALAAGEDSDRWEQSGAAAFTEDLIDMLLHPLPPKPTAEPGAAGAHSAPATEDETGGETAPETGPEAGPETAPESAPEAAAEAAAGAEAAPGCRVRPKRVRRNPADRLRTRLPSLAGAPDGR